MRRQCQDLADTAISGFLAGGSPDDAGLGDLAEFVSAVHRVVDSTPPRPSRALAAIFSDGLDPGSSYALITARPSPPAKGRALVRTVVTRLAAFGMFVKLGLGAAVAAAATTGAGAAGVLPAPVQDAVAGVVGTVTPFELPSSASDTAREAVERRGGPEDGGTGGGAPAPAADFGQGVADDATGESDGEAGVDGREVADEASDGRSSDLPDQAEDRRRSAETNRETAGDRQDHTPDGADEGRIDPEDRAPGRGDEQTSDAVPARPAPGQGPADPAAEQEPTDPPAHGRR